MTAQSAAAALAAAVAAAVADAEAAADARPTRRPRTGAAGQHDEPGAQPGEPDELEHPAPVEQRLHVKGQALVVDVLGRVGQRRPSKVCIGASWRRDRRWLRSSVHGLRTSAWAAVEYRWRPLCEVR
jgi:hypothetical protein